MSGKLPIDRAREARDAPAIYDQHRERVAELQARLADRDDISEGERPPEQPADTNAPGEDAPLVRDHLPPRGSNENAEPSR